MICLSTMELYRTISMRVQVMKIELHGYANNLNARDVTM